MRYIIILAMLAMSGLYAEDTIQENYDKKLAELDKKYMKAKRKLLDDARDDYKKLEIAATKKGKLDGALEYRKKVEDFENEIANLDLALKKDPAYRKITERWLKNP